MLVVSLLVAGSVAALPPAPAMEGLPPTFDDETLVARPSSQAPAVDGVVEALWSGAHELEVVAAGASGNFPPGSGIKVRALHNFTHLFLLVSWPDAAPDASLDAWQLVDNSTPEGGWVRTGWGHDALAVFLDNGTGAEQNFSSLGCTAVCHSGTAEMYTTGPGILDLWHWSASRSAPLGFADDRYLDNATRAGGSPAGGFHPDAADPWSDNNVTTPSGPRPAYLNGSAPATAGHIADADKQAVNWSTFDSASLPNGTVVPGWVLLPPAPGEGDVAAAAAHGGNAWTVEIARPFVTGDAAGRDVPIVDLGREYYFSLSVTNNRTAENHSTPIGVQKLVFAENLEPDLVVRSASPLAPTLTAGAVANVSALARNNGFADAPASAAFAVVDLSNASEVGRTVVGPLAWSQERVLFITFPTAGYPPGVHNFSLVADYDDDVAESNESNNERPFNLTVVAPSAFPDLVLSNVTGPAGPVFVPDNLTVTGTVLNVGTGATGADVRVRATNDSLPPAEAVVGPLAAGESADFTLNLSTASASWGTYLVTLAADPDDEINEGSPPAEGNNSAGVYATIESRPNLVAQPLTLFPAAVLAGETTEINVTLTNLGARAAGRVTVWTYLDNATSAGSNDRVLVWTADIDLAPGAFTRIATPWQVPAGLSVGPHSVRVWVDAERLFGEIDESDNNRSAALTVLEEPRPDLTIPSVSLNPSAYRAGESATVTAQVLNVGANYSAAVVIEVRDSLSNITLGSSTFGPVPEGESRAVEVVFTVPAGLAGLHLITVSVDPDDALLEASELNNSRTISYELLPEPRADLTVGALSSSPAAPTTGDTVQLRVDVHNDGSAATEATDGAFRVGNTVIGYVAIPALAPGSGTTVSLNWDTGGFTGLQALITFIADVNDTVVETNEADNTATFTLPFTRPGAAAFRLGALTRAPPTADPGEVVRLEVTVRNDGTAPGSARLRLLVDGLPLLDEAVDLGANGSVTLAANWTANASGTHIVRAELLVAGEVVEAATGTVTVARADVELPADLTWAGWVAALLVAGVAAFYFLRMRRRPPAADATRAPME